MAKPTTPKKDFRQRRVVDDATEGESDSNTLDGSPFALLRKEAAKNLASKQAAKQFNAYFPDSSSITSLPLTRIGQTTSEGSTLPPTPPALRRSSQYRPATRPGAVSISPSGNRRNAVDEVDMEVDSQLHARQQRRHVEIDDSILVDARLVESIDGERDLEQDAGDLGSMPLADSTELKPIVAAKVVEDVPEQPVTPGLKDFLRNQMVQSVCAIICLVIVGLVVGVVVGFVSHKKSYELPASGTFYGEEPVAEMHHQEPSHVPTAEPTTAPFNASVWAGVTPLSTQSPTPWPTVTPTLTPSLLPTSQRSSSQPSLAPSRASSTEPSLQPSSVPSLALSRDPTLQPYIAPAPTQPPSATPTLSQEPTTASPVAAPTKSPTFRPTASPVSNKKPSSNDHSNSNENDGHSDGGEDRQRSLKLTGEVI